MLSLVLLLGAFSAAPAASRRGDEASFEYSMNMLRVCKNRFYNAAEAALAEDAAFSKHLYMLFDFVYADAMLDMFADCMRDPDALSSFLRQKGYEECAAFSNGSTRALAVARAEGVSRICTAEYDPKSESACLRVFEEGGLAAVYSWRREPHGYAVQYMYPAGRDGSTAA